jgi:hypothetical protein
MLLYIGLFIITYFIMAHITSQDAIQNITGAVNNLFLGGNDDSEGTRGNEPFDLTPIDVVVTRIMLTKGKKLPPSVVDVIFDFAEYWAHSSNEIDYMAEHQSPLRVNGASASENRFLVSEQGHT